MNVRASCLLAALLAVLGGGAAFAHDPYEITALARLETDALVLEVTMARSTALAVATGNRDAVPFEPAAFATVQPQLAASAGKLFTLAAASGPLALRHAETALGVENDVDFRLVYPRPAAGVLRFTAACVEKLGRDFGATLTVQGDRGTLLGQQTLTAASPALDVTIAAAAAPTRLPASSTNTNIALPAVALAIALVGGGWLWRRQAPN